jgi:hypothetical protein
MGIALADIVAVVMARWACLAHESKPSARPVRRRTEARELRDEKLDLRLGAGRLLVDVDVTAGAQSAGSARKSAPAWDPRGAARSSSSSSVGS